MRLLLAALPAFLLACDFTSSHDPNTCTEDIPAACGGMGHCVLQSNQYLSGSFPGAQTFIIRTDQPRSVTFQFTFTNRETPGTGLSLTSTEPDCSEQSSYTSMGDLFELAGASGVISFPIQMIEAGDHLVQFHSDAYCNYEMLYQ
jgi:hypothetical protein